MSEADGYLVLDQVAKSFPGQRSADVVAVDHVSLSVPRGQLVTLLGPSGCGKTTTLRLIAGFEQPDEGVICLDGRRLNEVPPNRRDMAMVFQSYAIFPHLSVFENVAYGLRVRGMSNDDVRQRLGRALDLVGMLGLENRQPNQLSGGQQQRVALARALVMEPKVLLFDEPLSNLDAKLRLQMREQIRQIQQHLQITSVYVTHDQAEAMVLSDLIVVMSRGRVEQVGSPFQVYRQPSTAFVADFIGKANFVKGTVAGVGPQQMRIETLGGRLTVPADWDVEVGDEVTLVVRPDAVSLASDGAQFVGTVRRAFFLGPQVDYEIEVAGEKLAVVEHDPRGAVPREPGSAVGLSFIEEAIAILPRHHAERPNEVETIPQQSLS